MWDKDRVLELPECTVRLSSRLLAMEDERLTFEQTFRFPDETLLSRSTLRFWSRREIEERLVACGLRVDKVLGDWGGGPFDEASSREMIFIGGTAPAAASKAADA